LWLLRLKRGLATVVEAFLMLALLIPAERKCGWAAAGLNARPGRVSVRCSETPAKEMKHLETLAGIWASSSEKV
jgi:hypothetical protein